MLHSLVLRGVASFLLATLVAVSASAQTKADMSGAPISAADRAKYEEIARELQSEALRGAQDPNAQAQAAQIARKADAIANPDMARERAKVLRFLGINPDSEHAVFVFVSWSMPLEMLRAYAIEAMWTGSTLVFRGVPPGRKVTDFFIKDLQKLVWDKGASAAISVDPRLFDSYEIKVVPAIVLTRTRDNFTCMGAGQKTVRVNGREGSYPVCPAIAADKYLKLSGSVTLDFALETFSSQGWKEADTYLAALRRGYQPGQEASRDQQAFRGEWKDAITPQQLMEQHQAEERARAKAAEQAAQ